MYNINLIYRKKKLKKKINHFYQLIPFVKYTVTPTLFKQIRNDF